MLREFFLKEVNSAISELINEKNLGEMSQDCKYSLQSEIPKNTQFGDFAVNVSSLSRYTKLPPNKTAEIITQKLNNPSYDVNVTAGFINFKLKPEMLNKIIVEVLDKKHNYAKNNIGNNEKVILEYVSANPTGPFHIGHGRWAAMGSALANVMKYSGYDVFQEFYINDAGSQIQKLGKSLYIRILQQLSVDISFPDNEEEAKEFYTGDFLIPTSKEFIEQNSSFAQSIKANWNGEFNEDYLQYIAQFARLNMLEKQKKLLEQFNVHFDNFYSELTLHDSGKVKACIEKLKDIGVLYEKDGAIWFSSSKYGDEKDRVIKKSDGAYTYLTADIAYHYDKLQRGFTKLLNIWGADHHGYIARMRAAIEVLGYNPDCLEVLLGQLVNIVINGEEVRMGKRTKMVTLDDLIEEVGVDATRYWMIMKSIDTTLDFDVELAKSKTDDNPVFYVQYAHARACSIIRNALNPFKMDVLNNEIKTSVKIDLSSPDFSVLWKVNDEKAKETTKKLILKLEEYKSIVQGAAKNRAPYLITKYLQELAADFHKFYAFSKVIVEEEELMRARLNLVNGVIIILQSALELIGVRAPEKM